MKIGIVLMIEGNETVFGVPRYRTIRDMAVQAEAAGFDSLWLYDHFLFHPGPDQPSVGQWECFTFLSALAEATERVELGTLVACAGFRNPAVLAKMAVTLDEVSQGRFILGIGAGWNGAEFHAYGLPFDHRVDRFEEALEIIAPLLREGYVNFQGRYSQANGCEMIPRGPSPRGPRLMVGAYGPRMLRLAARHADLINTSYPPDNHTEQRAALDAACADVGRDPATFPITMPVWLSFPDLGYVAEHMRGSAAASVEEVVTRLKAHAEAGLEHIMIDFRPNTPEALARLSEALAIYRAEGG